MTRPITVLIIAIIVGTVLVMAAPTSTRAYWQLPVEHVCSMSAQDGQFTWKVFMNAWSENLSFTWEVLDDPEFSGETGGPIEVTPANDQYNPVYFTTPASGAQRVRVSWSYEMGGTQIDASWTAESYRCLIVQAVTNPASPAGTVHIDVYIDEPSGPDYIGNALMGFTPGDTRVLHGYGPGFSPGVEIASYALNWAFVGYVILDDPRDTCPAVPAYGEDPSPYADNGALAVELGDDLATFTRKVCVATHAMPLQDDGGGGGEPGGPQFTLSKEGSASPGPDGRIGFRLIVTNAGSTAGIVEVQDALPSGFDWRVEQVPSRLLSLDCSLDELLLLCDPETLEPGQAAVVNVVAPMPDGFCGQVQNTAQYRSGTDAADGPWQDSNTVTVAVDCSGAAFTVEKTGNLILLPGSGRVTFQLNVTNTGSETGFIEIQDPLPVGLDWSIDMPPPVYQPVDCAIREAQLVCQPTPFEAGQTRVIRLSAKLPDGFCGQIQNTAQYRSGVDAADGPWQRSNTVSLDVECGGPPQDGDQREFFDVVIRKVVMEDDGTRQPGAGWQFVIEGCGGQLDGVTGKDGTIRWSGIPVPQDCDYRVSEVVQRGWVVLAPGAVRFITSAAPGELVTMEFVNQRTGGPPGDPPGDNPPQEEPPGEETAPVAGPTEPSSPPSPSPGTPGNDVPPPASETSTPAPAPPAGVSTPTPERTDDVAGERETATPRGPAATGTPKPPATGNGTGQLSKDQWGVPLAMSAVALLVLAATVVMAGTALRR